ncbi:MAG: hypothetical protein LKF88_02960 [Microbacteriaceae bacterium]|jgi:hypothetical protein|nr:hypothetical protein [Microbacteriaceae bacterium]MCI1207295.1 hypothetical protein [Microbacteriaceae bacterium]
MRSSAGGVLRSLFSFLLLVVGVPLIVLGALAGWTQSTFTDSSGFVRTFAPLSTDTRVHSLIVDKVTETLSSTITPSGLDPALSRRLDEAGVSDATKDAIRAQLSALLIQAQTQLRTQIRALTSSSAFDTVWRSTLAASHRQAVQALRGEALSEGRQASDGALGVQTRPIALALQTRLQKDAPILAALIPTSAHTVAVTPAGTVDRLRPWDALSRFFASWGLALGAAATLAGLLLARHRVRALGISATVALLLLALCWAAPSVAAPAAELSGIQAAQIAVDAISPGLNAALAPWAVGAGAALLLALVCGIVLRHRAGKWVG